jgi:hypothetical protein
MTWFLDLRAQSAGGGVAADVAIYMDDTPASVGALEDAIRNRDVLIATHGFNVNRQSGKQSLSCWEQWQSLPNTYVFVAVLWPGDSAWIPAVDYPIEGNEASKSGDLLASFLLRHLSTAASTSFVSHSLGARVILQTLRGIKDSLRTRNVLLMAGAIDDTCLSDEYKDVAQWVDRISVLSSHHDQVLALAFPLGNFLSGIVTRGSPYWHAALGREGPSSTLDGKVQVGWQILNPWKYGHHNYLPHLVPKDTHPALPAVLPAVESKIPDWATFDEWQCAWSAAILATRFS